MSNGKTSFHAVAGDDVVRLHEKWMNGTDRKMEKIENKIGKIPWILLGVAVNIIINLATVVYYMTQHNVR